MYADILKSQLEQLVDKINLSLGCEKLSVHQQPATEARLSVLGGNGRLCINPTSEGYKIGLSGIPLTNEMYGFMREITGKPHDIYEFPADERLPKWKVENFSIIEKAVHRYAQTTK